MPKINENWLRVDKVIAMTKWCDFWPTVYFGLTASNY